jgi:hypothetical protein
MSLEQLKALTTLFKEQNPYTLGSAHPGSAFTSLR